MAALSILLALAGPLGAAAPAAAVALPGGKANYVVSFGSLYPAYGSHWVSLVSRASFYPHDDPDPRKHDMLSVFRVAEWT